MSSSIVTTSADGASVIIERVFDAPRALIFKLVTDPFHLAHFYGPRGVTNPICEMDVRPGGVWRHVMRFPDGSEYADHQHLSRGGRARAHRLPRRAARQQGGLDGLPPAQLVTSILFEELDGRTRLTAQFQRDLHGRRGDKAMGFAEAMSQGNEKLAAYLD